MTPIEKLQQTVRGQEARATRRETDWAFEFGTGNFINVEAAWRIRNTERILLVDTDDGQQFGLPSPVDAASTANNVLSGRATQSVAFNEVTGDLTLQLSGSLWLEVLTNSSGYESWQAYSQGELIAVGGNGGLR